MRDRARLRIAVAKALRGEGWPLSWDETTPSRRRPWLELADAALDAIEQEEPMKLVPDWREAGRWWSVRLHALASMILLLFALQPSMPKEIVDALPVSARVLAVGAWAALGLYARVAKQK